MNIMIKKLFLICLILILLAAVAYFSGIIPGFGGSQAPEQTEAVKTVVLEFGKKLQNVPVTGTKSVAAQSIQENYSPFVSPELLAYWKNDPASAPGRAASGPRPDRIEILTATATGPDSFAVTGNVVEITDQQVANGGIAAVYQAGIALRKQNDRWVITVFKKGPYLNIVTIPEKSLKTP